MCFHYLSQQFNSESMTLSTTGYSVLEAKKLLSRDDYTVVTGSPRNESKGAVVLGTKMASTINPVHSILGEQLGSYFGSSLAVTDLNNDKCVSAHYIDYIYKLCSAVS